MPGYLSPKHLDYIQRVGQFRPLFPLELAGLMGLVPEGRSLSRISGVGKVDKTPKPDTRRRVPIPTEDVIANLHSLQCPLAFYVSGKASEVGIRIGTWVEKGSAASVLADRQGCLNAAMRGLYTTIELEPSGTDIPVPPACSVGLGIPTAKSPDPLDGALPMDRIIRAMSGMTWGYLVLAIPIPEEAVISQRNSVIEEIRLVQSGVEGAGVANPLASHYIELLSVLLYSLTSAVSLGAWRTAVYLMGDAASAGRLSGLWSGVFGGDDSLPEAIHVFNAPSAGSLAARWSMLDYPPEQATKFHGPGEYQYPFQLQSLLTSSQLAAYIHLPQNETGGFRVTSVARFDLVPNAGNEGGFELGKIITPDSLTEPNYDALPGSCFRIESDALTKHAFVPGVTGSGKTTTIFNLLKQAGKAKIPFLVIEPAKTEYRELANHEELGSEVQIFTIGNEEVSPIRLNPFHVVPGTSILNHIDLLRSVFSATFGLWTPLPQILEECLHLTYEDRGWDIAGDVNSRTADRNDPQAFPTLSDLIAKVDEVMSRSVWDPEATARIRGALRDRLNSLRVGAKGRMLDVQRSLPMDVLLERNTIIELEGLGDDDDKAFMMGLLLIRLVEYRRSSASRGENATGLRHLLVFEEAHRLLTNVAVKGDEGAANPRSKAVESFGNLLSEVRAYGQGVIIADQVPVRLAPDVIKNTNLKIAHRVVDSEDRKVLAGSMAMTEEQSLALTTFLPGSAAAFLEGEDAPLLIRIPRAEKRPRPEDAWVRDRMARLYGSPSYRDAFLRHKGCLEPNGRGGAACDAAREISEGMIFRRDFCRLVLSVVEDGSALRRLLPTLERHVVVALVPSLDASIVTGCAISWASEWYAARRGAQAGWTYADTTELSERLRLAVVGSLESEDSAAIGTFRECFLRLHKRVVAPYSRCDLICDKKPPACLYRQGVRDLISGGEFAGRWSGADPLNAPSKAATWAVCQRVAEQLIEWAPDKNGDAIRRIGLCYGQMMVALEGSKITPEYGDQVLEALRLEAKPFGK